ncbi:hypothetical protein C3747_101g15 [Trypanosoma cruzi]|uniref:Uncharacterized protein n=2 Tax=Trypanosoma cruzi TaxID=5693 RepID=Q4D423_TRYCC|nr:hypothetical protein, conserved [Trypanosoma cruzi]EAN87281.1 hypothetical protein, conserved [Trypanosoma cruzi]PWV07441.1 hypothetical protein C3747_101g15 [Trypanosoma cruzi]RNC59316.1 hypothetical protein TcCL_ESM03001 [Trypanosoma cruzi]|eukprot:XP_809132.1 hypothetical protein [Trypanosoma cruzi strain CL Brener]
MSFRQPDSLSESSLNKNNNTPTRNDVDGATSNGSQTPPTSSHLRPIGGDSPNQQSVDLMHPMTPSVDTPRFGQNGICRMSDWNLSPASFSIPLNCSTPPPPTRLARATSVLSSSSQRYCHDPYSLGGSQRLSPQSNPISNAASPPECPIPSLSIEGFDDNATGPLTIVTVMAAVPKERNETRGRRKGRNGDHSRNSKALPDLPPPRVMRYLPPPPPGIDNVTNRILSLEELHPIAKRWYDRTIAAEASYSQRISSSVWLPTFGAMAQQQPLIPAGRAVLCPRVEHYPNSFWQWLADAERWWEGAVRPHTGTAIPPPPPPPYLFGA